MSSINNNKNNSREKLIEPKDKKKNLIKISSLIKTFKKIPLQDNFFFIFNRNINNKLDFFYLTCNSVFEDAISNIKNKKRIENDYYIEKSEIVVFYRYINSILNDYDIFSNSGNRFFLSKELDEKVLYEILYLAKINNSFSDSSYSFWILIDKFLKYKKISKGDAEVIESFIFRKWLEINIKFKLTDLKKGLETVNLEQELSINSKNLKKYLINKYNFKKYYSFDKSWVQNFIYFIEQLSNNNIKDVERINNNSSENKDFIKLTWQKKNKVLNDRIKYIDSFVTYELNEDEKLVMDLLSYQIFYLDKKEDEKFFKEFENNIKVDNKDIFKSNISNKNRQKKTISLKVYDDWNKRGCYLFESDLINKEDYDIIIFLGDDNSLKRSQIDKESLFSLEESLFNSILDKTQNSLIIRPKQKSINSFYLETEKKKDVETKLNLLKDDRGIPYSSSNGWFEKTGTDNKIIKEDLDYNTNDKKLIKEAKKHNEKSLKILKAREKFLNFKRKNYDPMNEVDLSIDENQLSCMANYIGQLTSLAKKTTKGKVVILGIGSGADLALYSHLLSYDEKSIADGVILYNGGVLVDPFIHENSFLQSKNVLFNIDNNSNKKKSDIFFINYSTKTYPNFVLEKTYNILNLNGFKLYRSFLDKTNYNLLNLKDDHKRYILCKPVNDKIQSFLINNIGFSNEVNIDNVKVKNLIFYILNMFLVIFILFFWLFIFIYKKTKHIDLKRFKDEWLKNFKEKLTIKKKEAIKIFENSKHFKNKKNIKI